MTTNDCARWLAEHDGYLILSHKRPDGDTLGSGAAICSALRRAGKTAYCIANPDITENFIPHVEPYIAPEGYQPRTVVAVDIADTGLFPQGFDGAVDLCIDHHPSNTYFAGNSCVYAEKASCGEVVMEVVEALNGSLTQEEADLLYIAVSTDTGCFQYSNVKADTFRAAGHLIDAGADHKAWNTKFFRTMSPARMKLEGMIYSGLRFFRGGKIVAATVTQAMLDSCGADDNDCDDLAGIAGKAAGNVVSMTIRETDPGKCKISLRSHPEVNVSEICAVHGGGGHAMASGCTLDMDPESALQTMLRTINEKWPES